MGEESLRRIPATLSAGEPRVTVVVLSWNRVEPLARCLDSLARNVRMPFRLLVVDNGSEPDVRAQVAALVATQANAELQQLETNLGCSAARQLAAEHCATEYVAFVDDDAEVFAGTIENLVATLQEHPAARVAGARVVLPDGRVQHCGGDFAVRGGIIRFLPLERGRAVDDPAITSRPCRWIGGTAFACRSALFADFPLDRGMSTYFEDNEWCYRIAQAEPDAFRTAADALVLHHQQSKERQGSHRDELLRATRFLAPLARFYERHGLVQDDLFGLVRELALPDEGRDVAAARLLLELVMAKGSDWVALQWLSGGLEPLFLRQPLAALTSSRWYRLASLYWRVRKGRR
jgi:GT2 family glycosyltransferase